MRATLLVSQFLFCLRFSALPLTCFSSSPKAQEGKAGGNKSNKGMVGSDRNLIINGDEAPRGRYPYIASLARRGVHLCGGTLIAPDCVLTAAHCQQATEIQLGRHDLLMDEDYESFVIERRVSHPRHRPFSERDVDVFDFMILKLYGRSRYQPVTLNRNPKLPPVDQSLWVAGWGLTEANQKSDVLMEATVDYIPIQECLKITGLNDSNETIEVRSEVFDSNICAIDFQDDEDSCQGDSGGPLIAERDTTASKDDTTNDLQVGVVSFGFSQGCADSTFPGVYGRVSYVQDWLEETLCDLSDFSPEGFNCPKKDSSIDPDGDLVAVTITISLDSDPWQTGWVLTSLNKAGNSVYYVDRPIGTYRDRNPNEVLTETLALPNNRLYNLTMLDRNGDGMYDGNFRFGRVTVRDPVTTHYDNRPMSFGSWITLAFEIGQVPSVSPTTTAYPTASPRPSPAPTLERPFVTVVIRFDRNVEETGWRIEKVVNQTNQTDNSTEVIVQDLIEVRYPGTYSRFDYTAGSIIGERVYLDYGTYQFVATDNEGNGICCSRAVGYFRVYEGEASSLKTAMVEIDRFNFEASSLFTIMAPVIEELPSDCLVASWNKALQAVTWGMAVFSTILVIS